MVHMNIAIMSFCAAKFLLLNKGKKVAIFVKQAIKIWLLYQKNRLVLLTNQ